MGPQENKSDVRDAVGQVTGMLRYCSGFGLVGKIEHSRYGWWSRKSQLQHTSPATGSEPVNPKPKYVSDSRRAFGMCC